MALDLQRLTAMAARIEDYALIGDCETAALVAKDGSIDWLCVPRFDSGACFAALLGTEDNGRWQIAPQGEIRKCRRAYRDDTLVLETEFETDEGVVALIDCMPIRTGASDVLRIVEGRSGRVPMRMEFVVRFDYGAIVPWVQHMDDGVWAIAGPDALHLHTPVRSHGKDFRTIAEFTVTKGERVPFVLTWHPSHLPHPEDRDPEQALRQTEEWWRCWSAKCTYQGKWRNAVMRSLITLKALTYAPTGGVLAAATTSLPECLGGVRNWDYRFCWLRDATFTLFALMGGGYTDEARAWRQWLVRAVAGKPSQLQIMYGLAGERRLPETTLDWLHGYENSRPVRIGNAAVKQHQLDVYGEVMDTLHLARKAGLEASDDAWRMQRALMQFLKTDWQKPDEGIWEVRGPRRHFTHSKVMAWVAADRVVQSAEMFGLEGPVQEWKQLRDAIHRDVCEKGFNKELNSFVQYYGANHLDASLLVLPLVGFLPPEDSRIRGTVTAIEKQLMRDGFVMRYPTMPEVDGLPPGEGVFLVCTFWLADNLMLQGRMDDACEIFERLQALQNDVGLLSEEYDPRTKRFLGNFPQAFSHVGLINTARNLANHSGPAKERPKKSSG